MMIREIEIAGDNELVDITARAKIIENLLSENKVPYTKYFAYGDSKDSRHLQRHMFNTSGEFIIYVVKASEERVNFIWHLYSEIYSQMYMLAVSYNRSKGN